VLDGMHHALHQRVAPAPSIHNSINMVTAKEADMTYGSPSKMMIGLMPGFGYMTSFSSSSSDSSSPSTVAGSWKERVSSMPRGRQGSVVEEVTAADP
jgi:hypothetical protein